MKVSPVSLCCSNSLNRRNQNREVKNVPVNSGFGYTSPQQSVSFGGLLKTVFDIAKEVSGYNNAVKKLLKNKTVENKVNVFVDKIDSAINRRNITNRFGKVKGFEEYRSSNAGEKLVRKVELNPDDSVRTITTFEYVPNSKNNELARTFNYDAQGKLQWETRYKYDEKSWGRSLSETADYAPDGTLRHKTRYFNDGVRADYDAQGNELKRSRNVWRSDAGYSTEVMELNPNSPYYGKIQVLDEDFNLFEVIKFEEIHSPYYRSAKEYAYYPSGKLKRESEWMLSSDGFGERELSKNKELYESGALKYIKDSSGYGYKKFYENGTLMEEQKVSTGYSGTRTYISNINTKTFAQDGKTVIRYSDTCPQDSEVFGINERAYIEDYSADGKMLKKVYGKSCNRDRSTKECYTVTFDDKGNLSSIYNKEIYSPDEKPDFKAGDNIENCSDKVKELYRKWVNANKK